MKLGIVVYSNDPETVWNAFGLGVFALQEGDHVSAFLLGKGVEAESLDSEQFKVAAQMKAFKKSGGMILASGTCLKSRDMAGTEICPVSTIADLYDLISESDKVMSF